MTDKLKQGYKTLTQAEKDSKLKGKDRLAMLKRKVKDGEITVAHNMVKSLKPWHLDMLRDRYVWNMKYRELAEKYDTSEHWVTIVCKSDVGIKAAEEIVNSPDVNLIRNKLKHLSSKCYDVCQQIIDGKTEKDEISKLDRGKFALELLRIAGVPEVKEHKFTFEHVLKQAGDAVMAAEKEIEGVVIQEALVEN